MKSKMRCNEDMECFAYLHCKLLSKSMHAILHRKKCKRLASKFYIRITYSKFIILQATTYFRSIQLTLQMNMFKYWTTKQPDEIATLDCERNQS